MARFSWPWRRRTAPATPDTPPAAPGGHTDPLGGSAGPLGSGAFAVPAADGPYFVDPQSPPALILDSVLGGVDPRRLPTPGQRAALVDTITRALADGWRRDALERALSRWDTAAPSSPEPAPAYVLIRLKLGNLAPAVGFTCPVCRHYNPDRVDVDTGFCRIRCRENTGSPRYIPVTAR